VLLKIVALILTILTLLDGLDSNFDGLAVVLQGINAALYGL
jgi:hypothetical protein